VSDCSWPGCQSDGLVTIADPHDGRPFAYNGQQFVGPNTVTGDFCMTHARRVVEDDEWSVNELPEYVESDVEWITGSGPEVADD